MKKIVAFSLSLLSLPIFGMKPEVDNFTSNMKKKTEEFQSEMINHCLKKCLSAENSPYEKIHDGKIYYPQGHPAHCIVNHYFQYRDFLIRKLTSHCESLPFNETFSYNPSDKSIKDSKKTKKAKLKCEKNKEVCRCAKAHLAEFDRIEQFQKQETFSAIMELVKNRFTLSLKKDYKQFNSIFGGKFVNSVAFDPTIGETLNAIKRKGLRYEKTVLRYKKEGYNLGLVEKNNSYQPYKVFDLTAQQSQKQPKEHRFTHSNPPVSPKPCNFGQYDDQNDDYHNPNHYSHKSFNEITECEPSEFFAKGKKD